MVDAYPLQWPPGWNQTQYPKRSQFHDHSIARATSFLMVQLKMLGATNVVVSTNLALRKTDGQPYSRQRLPEDRGVAVYFRLNGENQCMPCDKWNRIEDNIWAIAKCVEALRGLDRWGAKEMVNASFRGFKALPAVATQPKVNYFDGCEDKTSVNQRYRLLVRTYHPDHGGDQEDFIELTRQYEIKLQEFR